jgi:hypothetical protein
MSESEYLEVDPRTLHLPPSRASGAEPVKLQRQIAVYGASVDGMPGLWVYRGSDGALMIYDGVTRVTRVALLLPGAPVRVEVIGNLTFPCGHLPTVGEYVP